MHKELTKEEIAEYRNEITLIINSSFRGQEMLEDLLHTLDRRDERIGELERKVEEVNNEG